MGLDGGLDLKGKGQSLPALLGGNPGLGVLEDAGEEGLKFEAEGLAWCYGGLVEAQARRGLGELGACRRGGLWVSLWRCLWVDGDDEEVLPGVVDRDVLVGLEEAEFADALCADATGGEVGDAA